LHGWWHLWVAGCICLLLVVRALPALVHPLPWGPNSIDWIRIFLNNVLLVPGICLLLYGLIDEPSRLRSLLGSRPFDLFGKASYALYLIHIGVIDEFVKLHVTTNLPVRFIIANVLAIALYKGVEHPLYRRLIPRKPELLS
jgi:peptidoglycan/LPS O-acetylase OafA/YrhL